MESIFEMQNFSPKCIHRVGNRDHYIGPKTNKVTENCAKIQQIMTIYVLYWEKRVFPDNEEKPKEAYA